MKSFLQFIKESVSDVAKAARSSNIVAFWFNPKTNKAFVVQGTASFGPWHVTLVARDPKKFGTTKDQILKYIEKYDKNRNYQEDFEETAEGFYNSITSQLTDKSIGIENLMGEMGYFRCTLMRGSVVDAHLGHLKFGSVDPTNSQLRSFVEKISLIPSVTEIRLPDVGDIFQSDFEFFSKYGRIPKRTEMGSRMAQFREEMELNESLNMYKGWVNPSRKQMEIWQTSQKPWHTQAVLKNPEKFGCTKEDLMKVIKDDQTRASSSSYEKYYENLMNGLMSVDWSIETLLVKDGWVKVTVDMRISGDGKSDVQAIDAENARAALKMLERKIPSLPEAQIMVWTGDDMTRMSRTVAIHNEAHYKTFVKMGRIPIGV